MKIFNELGREVRPNMPAARPGDDDEPLARPAAHWGIFREVSGLAWAHAQVGSSFCANDGSRVLILGAGENYDGPRWDRLSLSLAPANWRQIEVARVATEKAKASAAAACESARLASLAQRAARVEAARAALVAAGLPDFRTYTTGGGWADEDEVGYAAGPSSEWVPESTETVDVAEEIVRLGRDLAAYIAESLRDQADALRLAVEQAARDAEIARAAAIAQRSMNRQYRIAARSEIRRAITASRAAREILVHSMDGKGWFNASYYSALIERILRCESARWVTEAKAEAAREEAARAEAWAIKNPKKAARQAAQAASTFTGQKLVNNPFANFSL